MKSRDRSVWLAVCLVFVTLGLFSEIDAEAVAADAGHEVAAAQSADDEAVITRPPAELGLNPIYTKYLSAEGFPIVATAKTDDRALFEAAYVIDQMLANRPDIRKKLIERGARLVIWAHNEFTTDLPEWADMKPKDFWDRRARGLGGLVCSVGEENLLGLAGDPYEEESILVHEFAHNVHLQGLNHLDPEFDKRLRDLYTKQLKKGLWEGTYASRAHTEYFAEAVQSYFNTNRQPDHDHNHVDTRAELKEYDPEVYQLLVEVFGPVDWVYTKPATRPTGHLAGFVPEKAPRFEWPEHLEKLGDEIRAKAVAEREKWLAEQGLLKDE